MKKIVFLLLIFASCQKESIKAVHHPSKVDGLRTEEEIEAFIEPAHEYFKSFKLTRIADFRRDDAQFFKNDSISKVIAQRLKVDKSFYKADFDNNGYGDLLIIGYSKGCGFCAFSDIAVLNFPNDSIKTISLNMELTNLKGIVPKIIEERDTVFLEMNEFDDIEFFQRKKRLKIKTTRLISKFGDFVEYNPKFKNHRIQKIEFSADGCFGTCPVYDLEINADKSAVFNARYYNFSKDRNITYGKEEGKYKAVIRQKDYQELVDILNYIGFAKLEKDYSVGWTDDQTGNLKITYDDGEIKEIQDYGMIGTYGLKKLYETLAALRFSQKWEKLP